MVTVNEGQNEALISLLNNISKWESPIFLVKNSQPSLPIETGSIGH